jgi:ribokinase
MITVVGSLNMDLVIEVPRFPAPGETMCGQNFRRAGGGKGANQACAVARMGMPTAMIGAVGQDSFGDEMLANLNAVGVNTSGVVRRKDVASGTALIILDDDGQNQIVLASGANATLSVAEIERGTEQIHHSHALLVQLETPLESVAAALRLARAAQVPTILNPAPFAPWSEDLLRLCDFIIPNESEASSLTGMEVRDVASAAAAAERLRERSHASVLITLGVDGVWLATKAFTGHVPAFVVQAVDTVGAGDAFIGAFAVRIVEGADVREAARFGCAAAAIAVTRRGAQAGIPSRAEVEKFLASNAPVV